MATFTTSALGAFFVVFAVDRGFAPAMAGLTVAVASVVNICMRVSRRLVRRPPAGPPVRPGCPSLVAGCVGYFILFSGVRALIPIGAVLAYGLGWSWQGLVHLGAVRFIPDAPGYATGLLRTGLAIGSATGPIAGGLLIGLAGYRVLWLLLGVLAAGSSGAIFLLLRTRAEAL